MIFVISLSIVEGRIEGNREENERTFLVYHHRFTLVNVYVDLVVFTRIAGTS